MENKSISKLLLIISFLVSSVATAWADPGNETIPRWTYADVINSSAIPFAIGHRGYGENLGQDADKPLENTDESIRRAFREGVQIVEVDAVITRDGRAVTSHDDFLADYTCINSLTFEELKERKNSISSLRQILQTSRSFNTEANSGRPSGLMVIEIKTPSPLCDPGDTSVHTLVESVMHDIEQAKMNDQVLIESFSPEILAKAAALQPGIPRVLALNILQLLPPEQIEALTGLPVTLIDKQGGFGLQWGQIGVLYRLPGYASVSQYVGTLIQTGSYSASLDKVVLAQMDRLAPGSASGFIAQLNGMGLRTLVYTVNEEPEWLYLSSMGVNGIYTDDVPLGISLEGR